MKIDWKHLATTPGYRSLKAAYIQDVKRSQESKNPMRKKSEFLRAFRWVIGRAQHYAHQYNVPIEMVLNAWEEDRGRNWWYGHYHDYRQHKLHKKVLQPRRMTKRHLSRKNPRRWSMAAKEHKKFLKRYTNL